MNDPTHHLGAVTRTVSKFKRDGKEIHAVIASRTYDTTIDDLWDALTTAERIPRWLMPVEGELKLGGRYQLKGNAGGEITQCEPPRHLAVTWEFRGNVSWVDVTLEPSGQDTTLLTLEHTAEVPPQFWEQFGPGATGVGWDLSLLGLGMHVEDGVRNAPEESASWVATQGGKDYMRASSDAWCEAAIRDGEDPGWAREAAERTRRFYMGE
jgi:uncharacterized protein YndB with AHSA1/START domain